MQLRHISRGLLVMFAGGDPWKVNSTLQSGRPAQISELAQAFHGAGVSTKESDDAFGEALRRFETSWNRENGEHPINDSAEVQRVKNALGQQSQQLPKIAVDLENIAATLAQAQRTCGVLISTLETRLQTLDDWIGQAEDLIRQDEYLLTQTDDEDDIAELEDDISDLQQYITDCEREAVDDTKSTLAQLQSIQAGYSDYLHKSESNLRTDGYDPGAIQELDSEHAVYQATGDVPPSGLEPAELADIKRVTNQAVADQIAKVRAAQEAVNDAMRTAYTKGQGSPEGQAALARLPELKKNLTDAINDLSKLPGYNNIDPTAIRTSPDGHFLFGYSANGQPVQVTGQLKNGTGEFFDQGSGTYYTFKDGKLVGMRTPDPGRAEATNEPLLTAVTLAVGAPELKAGGEAAWQGVKALLERQALGSSTDLASENVLARAAQGLGTQTDHTPMPPPPGAAADHPVPLTTTDHPAPPGTTTHTPPEHSSAPATTHDPPLAGSGPHATPPPPPVEVPPPAPHDSPLFDGYHPVEPGTEFTRADGSLIYPDENLASRPYAIPGTVIPDTHLPQGTELGRFGYPGGAYLAPEGTPFAQLSLPPESALKPYYQYVVDDPTALPPGWHIEQSQVAPWFHQPGGGTQYRIIAPPGQRPSVDELVESGYLKVVVKQ